MGSIPSMWRGSSCGSSASRPVHDGGTDGVAVRRRNRRGFGGLPAGRDRDFHCNSPEGGYDIHYLEGQGRSANEHTVLHETYEIIYETLCLLRSGFPSERKACRQADRFAAAVLMQPEGFAALASVALRLSEVMRDQPLLAVLYEREEREGPLFRTTAPVAYFRALVVARTPGFGARKSRVLNGTRGGTLRWGRPIPPG